MAAIRFDPPLAGVADAGGPGARAGRFIKVQAAYPTPFGGRTD